MEAKKKAKENSFWRETQMKAVPILFGIVIMFFLISYSEFSLEQLVKSWICIEWQAGLMIVSFSWFGILVISHRWAILVKSLTPIHQYARGFFFYYSCLSVMAVYFLSQAVGNIGVKTLALKQAKGIPISRGSFIVAVEHLLNLIIVLLFVVPSFLFLNNVLAARWTLALEAFLFALLLACMISYSKMLTGWLHKFLSGANRFFLKVSFLKRLTISIENSEITERKIDKNLIIKLGIYSCAIYFIGLYRNYIYAEALGIEIPLIPLILAFPFVYVISLIGVTPGSLGITELGWIGVLVLIGVEKEEAAIFAISIRVLNVVAILLVFAGSFLQFNIIPYLTQRIKFFSAKTNEK